MLQPRVFMKDPITGAVALYEEPSGASGAFDDPNSDRNAPLNDPIGNIDLVRFHSEWDYYQCAFGPTTVTVNHPSVAGASVTLYNLGGTTFTRLGQIATTSHLLLTHSLGYAPRFMVSTGGALISPGTLIQLASNQDRKITAYATTTEIRLYEAGTSSASALAALAVDYDVLVFKDPAADQPYEFDFDETTGRVIMGYGKFDSSLKTLRQAGASASPFDIALGRTIDIKNGGARTVLPDGTTKSDTNYNGTFTGSPSIQCAVQ